MDLKDEHELVWNDDDRDTSDIYSIYKNKNNKELVDLNDDEYIPAYKIVKQLYDNEKEELYNLYNNSEYEVDLKSDEHFTDYSDYDDIDDDTYSDDYYICEDFNDKNKTESYNNDIYDKLIYDKFYYY